MGTIKVTEIRDHADIFVGYYLMKTLSRILKTIGVTLRVFNPTTTHIPRGVVNEGLPFTVTISRPETVRPFSVRAIIVVERTF